MFNRAPGDQGHWKWRHYMAQQIADALDMEALNVKGVYLIGSSNTGDAGMGSDIDLILHLGEQSGEQNVPWKAGLMDGAVHWLK